MNGLSKPPTTEICALNTNLFKSLNCYLLFLFYFVGEKQNVVDFSDAHHHNALMQGHPLCTHRINKFVKWLIRNTYIPLVLIFLLSVDIGKASSANFQANIGTLYLFQHTAETEIKTCILSVFSPI
jgi:hypothetical protein